MKIMNFVMIKWKGKFKEKAKNKAEQKELTTLTEEKHMLSLVKGK